ncbi:site-specific integrase, partial [Pseudomonas syringae]|nr:site-specific integrase [Pseudomonas syringae]
MKNKLDDATQAALETIAEDMDIDFSEDMQDAAEQEIEQLLLETGGEARQIESTLLKKLELYPEGNFPVSAYSLYSDSSWIIFKDKDGTVTRVKFDDMSEHAISIKKSIIYHLIP